ncbi:MAG: gliding motility-associated C-terminal domain-containing protein [Saprospiraceae bacterium]
MTRFITCLVLGLMSMLTTLQAQTPTFSITPATINADPDDQFSVDITVSNFSDLISFQYAIKWDATLLQLDEVTNITTELPDFNANLINANQTGRVSTLWLDNNFGANTLTDGTVIYTLNFTALAAGTTAIEFTEEGTQFEVLNVNEEEVGLNPTNSTVVIGDGGDGGGGVSTDPVSISASSGNGESGTEVCVPVRVSNFTDITKFQFSINFDNSVIQYDRAQAFGITGLTASQFSAPSAGNVVVNYENTDGASVANNTVAFELCYDLIGAAGTSSNVSFSGSPTTIDVQRSATTINLNSTAGQITIDEDNGGGVNTDPVSVTAGSGSGENGTEVCVPVRVTDFTDITKFQFSINFDNSVIQYNRARTFGIPGLTASQFSTPSAGNVVVNYENTSAVSVANNTVAFELCYNVVGNANASSNITFSGTPTVIDVQRSGTNVALNSTAGQISVEAGSGGGMGNGDNPLSVIIGTAQGEVGNNVCVPISVVDFVSIISFQYSLSYPSDILSFTGVQNVNLAGLTNNSFGDSGIGTISVSWLDDNLEGVTLDNNTTIAELCFDVTAAGAANIDITNSPTSIEVTDETEQNIGLTPSNGRITATGGDGGGGGGGNNGGGDGVADCDDANGFTFVASDLDVAPGNNFCVDVVANDFTGIISLQTSMTWNPSIIQFTGIQNLNLAALNENNFNTLNTNQGELAVSWLDESTLGVSLEDCTDVIFTVCFTAIGDEGQSTDFTFGNSPIPIEVIGSDEEPVDVNTEPGTINLLGEPIPNIIFTAGDITTDEGASFCFPVTVQGFMNISSVDYDMEYDATLLQFDRVEVTNNVLPSFNTFNFRDNVGSVNLDWSGTTGVDVPDNTVLYNICFNAIGAGSTNASFANAQITNGDGQEVPFVGNRSNINIVSGEPITPITLGETFFPSTGDQRCAVVTAQNFDNIISFQYGMTWDNTLFRYENVNILSGGNTLNLRLIDFGYSESTPNLLSVSWIEENFENASLPDGEPMYEICFTALGPQGTRNPLVYSETPVQEVTDEDGNILPFNGGTGELIIGEETGGDLSFTADVTDASSPMASDGRIVLNLVNCNTIPTFIWSAPITSTTNTAENLIAGNYTVTVRCGDQSVTQTFTVNASAQIVVDPVIEDATCVNFTDGSITLNVTGGNPMPDYNYTWSDIGETSNRFRFNLTTGSYTVTITDGNGGSTVETYTVGGNTTALELQVNSVSNASCSNANDGGVDITITGGTPAYDVQWSDNPNEPMPVREDFSPGTYVITVMDANGCSEDESFNIGSENPGIEISNVQVTSITEEMAGMISLDVTGGTSTDNISYQWLGPNGFSAAIKDLGGLQMAGEYTLTVTDTESGCSNTITRFVNSPLRVTAVVTAACFGETGSIDITPSGGAAGEPTYVWTGTNFSATTQDIMDVAPGTYTLTITDTDNVQITENYTIEQSAEIITDEEIVNEMGATGSANGSITITASGGTGTLSYVWSEPITSDSSSAVGLTTGNYSVTITDELGCTQVLNNLIIENIPSPLAVQAEGVNTSCVEGEDGSIVLTITGGQFPYTIILNDNTITADTTEVIIENLSAGTYAIQVTSNAGGEPINITETVTEPAAIVLVEEDTNNFSPTDPAVCNGGINLGLTGGTEPYTVNWSGPDNYEGEGVDIVGLCLGDYVATVTDANGCTTVLDPISVILFEIDEAATTITNPACIDSETGRIEPVINGGRLDYTYAWSGPNSFTATTRDLENLLPGAYTLEVTDANQRTVSATFTLEPSSSLLLTTEVTTDYNGFAVSCADATDATLEAAVTSGSGDVTYLWSENNQTTAAIIVGAGTYSVTATDADGCIATAELTVAAPPALEVNFSVSGISCAGEEDGEITAMVTGGVPNYNYQWDDDNGSTNATVFGLADDNYTVVVIDDNNCTVTASQSIETVDPIQLNIVVENIEINQDGSAIVTPTGGTPPYTYRWDNIETDSVFVTAKEGEYTIIVEDANGCSASERVEIIFEVDCFTGRPIITPDGDGLNDEFIINCITQADNNTLQIFNRWGQLVFEQADYDNTWMGTNSRGSALPEGGYFWVLDYRDVDNTPRQVRGSLTIIIE